MQSTALKGVVIGGGVIVALLVPTAMLLTTKDDGGGKIVLGIPGVQYEELVSTYRGDLERHGVSLETRQSTEGFATFSSLIDATSGMQAALVKGGLFGSLQGRLATAEERELHDKQMAGKLRSIGRLFYEPIWVFTRGDLPIESLRDLGGRKILVGGAQSATRRITGQLLKANGVDATNATLVEAQLSGKAEQLVSGEVDAGIVILPADSDRIQELLRVPDIRLMDFSPEAEAYTNRFPALAKVVLHRGAVEFEPQLPSADITLLTTSAALIVRADMPPALVNILAYAVVHNPKSGLDKSGDPVLFHRAGEFPSVHDPEFETASEARPIYKTVELPVLLRMLAPINKQMGLPFSVTTFMWTHAATFLLLIPILAVALPMMRVVPKVYIWNVRRRLLYWYRQLRWLERSLDSGAQTYAPDAAQEELDRIDAAVRRIRIPHNFSDQQYDLRGHIELVRQRLMAGPMRMAAA